MKTTPVHIIWFKRDLRVQDHEPLWLAAQQEAPVLPLYIIEPSSFSAPEFDPAQWTFIQTCLEELRQQLAKLGQPLVVRIGEAVPTLEALRRQLPIARLWAHQEIAPGRGQERNRAVSDWATYHHIPFTELPQTGVQPALTNLQAWAENRQEWLNRPLCPTPAALQPVSLTAGRIPNHHQLRLPRDRRTTPAGGEQLAWQLLHSFVQERGANYILEMTHPLLAADSCSRLGPHLSYGTISGRAVAQTIHHRLREYQKMPPSEREQVGGRWQQSLSALESRLLWRDYLGQQFALHPHLEFKNHWAVFDGLRRDDPEKLDKWRTGRTGYPLIDASMRCLNSTGWLNFRLRAVVASFALFELWLNWREPGLQLARMLCDFEPGVLWPQLQLLAGTANQAPLTIFDPLQQSQQLDPSGAFIQQWVPELAGYPAEAIHTPWQLPQTQQEKYGAVVGRGYPAPVVQREMAVRHAQERLAQAQKRLTAADLTQAIWPMPPLAHPAKPAKVTPAAPEQPRLL